MTADKFIVPGFDYEHATFHPHKCPNCGVVFRVYNCSAWCSGWDYCQSCEEQGMDKEDQQRPGMGDLT